MSISFKSLLQASILASIVGITKSEQYCNCGFDVDPDLEKGCRFYGAPPDNSTGKAIEWYRASNQCLDALHLDLEAVDSDAMWVMCPYNNATNASASTISGWLKTANSEDALQNTIKSFFSPDYFVLTDNSTGGYGLVDMIVNPNEAHVDCVSTPNLCWNEFMTFLAGNTLGLNAICGQLHDVEPPSLRAEQVQARYVLCQGIRNMNGDGSSSVQGDVATTSSVTSSSNMTMVPVVVNQTVLDDCGDLATQVGLVLGLYPGVACQHLEDIADASQLPNPDTCTLDVATPDLSAAFSPISAFVGAFTTAIVVTAWLL